MGQQQSRGNQSIKNFSHSKFGKVTFLDCLSQNQTQKMEVQLSCDQTGYKKWKQNLKKRQDHFTNVKYLLLPLNHKFSSGGLCSYSGITKVTYKKLPYVLEDEIRSVKSKKLTFSQPQLWKLLLSLVSAKSEYMSLMKDTSSNLGNINPKNIFIDEKGTIKIGNPLSWPNDIDSYRGALLKETSYLSPEDMKSLELGALNNDANINSEMFSIGMTLLSTGLTENLQNLYNFQTNTFDRVKFQEQLILWKTTMYYSQILRVVVVCLLQIQPSKRMTLREMSQFLRPHISDIERQKPLKITNTSKKIDEKVSKFRQQIQTLLKYRFQKYSTQEKSFINQRPLSKQLRRITPSKINPERSVRENQNFYSALGPQNVARVKSQTKFTYSNKPLQNITPLKFVIENNPSPKIQNLKSVQKITQQTPSSPRVLRPKIIANKQKSQQIAEKLVQQGLVFTDSENHTQITQNNNRQSTQTVINQLQGFNRQSLKQEKVTYQKKQNVIHKIYAQTLIKCNFETAWIQYLAMIHRPDFYFPELENKVTLTDSKIQIPPGKVRLTANKQEGKIRLQNVSQNCQGQILGGVSKYSPDQVQVWFNSSYTYQGKPFPNEEYFVKCLQILKKKFQ